MKRLMLYGHMVLFIIANTDKCLKELTRVLKVGGILKLFIYGSGEFLVLNQTFKENFKNIDTEYISSYIVCLFHQ